MSINILGYEREKVMNWRWVCKDYMRWIEIWGKTRGTWWSDRAHGRVEIQRVGKHDMFEEPNSYI